MKKPDSTLTIYVDQTLADMASSVSAGEPVPSVERFLSIASHQSADNKSVDVIASCFGYQFGNNIPEAAVSRYALTQQQDNRLWALAEPLHMVPDRDQLLKMDPDLLLLDDEGARAILVILNEHFDDDDLQFEMITAKRWLLDLGDLDPQVTSAINSDPGLRHGIVSLRDDRLRPWVTRLTEIQMLLFSCDVNQQREAVGQYAINNIALYGAGRLPAQLDSQVALVTGNSLFANGLAMLNQIKVSAIDSTLLADLDEFSGDIVHVEENCDRRSGACADIEILLQTALDLLANGKLEKITLMTRDRTISANRWSLKKFWRRRHTLQHWANHDAG